MEMKLIENRHRRPRPRRRGRRVGHGPTASRRRRRAMGWLRRGGASVWVLPAERQSRPWSCWRWPFGRPRKPVGRPGHAVAVPAPARGARRRARGAAPRTAGARASCREAGPPPHTVPRGLLGLLPALFIGVLKGRLGRSAWLPWLPLPDGRAVRSEAATPDFLVIRSRCRLPASVGALVYSTPSPPRLVGTERLVAGGVGRRRGVHGCSSRSSRDGAPGRPSHGVK